IYSMMRAAGLEINVHDPIASSIFLSRPRVDTEHIQFRNFSTSSWLYSPKRQALTHRNHAKTSAPYV
ncbi:MAG: hypothetical protein LAP21_23560, partial [Acidobacteriia bacterium]|nr:hypothetical protein [Terriglobia bacterium]